MNYWDNLMGSDDAAATYMDTYGEGPECVTRENIAAFVNSHDSLLDVGCGPGWNCDYFANHLPAVKYRGEDYSERFVRVANKRRPGKFFLGDARDLQHPDNSFDVVVLQDCLEHTNGFETPVREALRVARRRVIVTFWHLTDTDNSHINDDGDDGWGAWYDKREWEKFLDKLGIDWFLYDFNFPENRLRHMYILDKEVP